MADFGLEALKDEIVNDPGGIGYKNAGDTWTGGENDPKNDQEIADLLNDRVNGATITRKLIRPEELKASFDLSEFVALSQGERDYLRMLVSGEGEVDANEASIFNALTSMFDVGSTTRTVLLAKIQRQGSRAEVLWGEGVVVRPGVGGVGAAFNLI